MQGLGESGRVSCSSVCMPSSQQTGLGIVVIRTGTVVVRAGIAS